MKKTESVIARERENCKRNRYRGKSLKSEHEEDNFKVTIPKEISIADELCEYTHKYIQYTFYTLRHVLLWL